MVVDCDWDIFVVKVFFVGFVCYKGYCICFGDDVDECFEFGWLYQVFVGCFVLGDELSYIVKLLGKGMQCVVQKVGEEGVEMVFVVVVLIEDFLLCQEFVGEVVDLFYYVQVFLLLIGVDLFEIVFELECCYFGCEIVCFLEVGL